MSGAKLLPCAHCGIELYACTEGWSGGTRYAHEANSCILSRKFVQGPEQEEAWNRRAALSVQLAAAVVGEPEGWTLVPIVPTQRMIDAGKQWTKPSYIYDAMLEAAPSPPDGAGRKQNALTYLSCAFAEISHRQDELRRLGAQMSNVIYNLAQTADLSVANREAMKELASQWDAAVGATLKEAETQS